MTDPRVYPQRPFLAVSAAIGRDGKVLLVRRARPPASGLYSLPGGVVEIGETLHQALVREVREETGMAVEPLGLAGDPARRERQDDEMTLDAVLRIADDRLAKPGEPCLNEELSEALWIEPPEVAGLPTTPGLAAIVAAASEQLRNARR